MIAPPFAVAVVGKTDKAEVRVSLDIVKGVKLVRDHAFGKHEPSETAILLWGWSDDRQQFVGFLHESAAEYEPVERPVGVVGIRPQVENLDDLTPFLGSVDGWIEIANRIKDGDRAACARGKKSCRIGGHLLEHRMQLSATTGRPETTVTRLALFDDYEADLRSAERHGVGSLATLAAIIGPRPKPPLPTSYLAHIGLHARKGTAS